MLGLWPRYNIRTPHNIVRRALFCVDTVMPPLRSGMKMRRAACERSRLAMLGDLGVHIPCGHAGLMVVDGVLWGAQVANHLLKALG